MDNRLEKALEFANFRTNFFNNKEHIKLKTSTMLIHSVNGGTFKSSPDLINFTKLLIDREEKSGIIIDNNGNPIEITDLQTFYDELFGRYFEATNYYLTEFTKIKKLRTPIELFKEAFDE